MAFAYNFDEQTGIVRIVGEGEVGLRDRAVLVRTLLADRQLPQHAALLIEVNRVTNAPTAEEARVIGVLINRLQSRFQKRVAIVNAIVGCPGAMLAAWRCSCYLDGLSVFTAQAWIDDGTDAFKRAVTQTALKTHTVVDEFEQAIRPLNFGVFLERTIWF